MPEDESARVRTIIPTFVEVGDWIFNARYVISARWIPDPHTNGALETTLETGLMMRMEGPIAAECRARLRGFVPPDEEGKGSGSAKIPVTRVFRGGGDVESPAKEG